MSTNVFTVTRIEGEYAYLEDENGEELFIAMALLPPGCDVGERLIYGDGGLQPEGGRT